jgi:secondary thiamine-phosphate synthase enzyme
MIASEKIEIQSTKHSQFILITEKISTVVRDNHWLDGVVTAFVQHTTCGITINENADPDVQSDLLKRLEQLVPWNIREDRHFEGNSAAHLKSTILGCSTTILLSKGVMQLGRWQGIYFGEFDGPRTRKILLSFNGNLKGSEN